MLHKQINLTDASIKMVDGQRVFEGYASIFGGVDSYGDTIAPGAYAKTIAGRMRPIRMRWNHYGPVIGKWMSISADGKGLYVNGQLTPGHSTAIDVYASLKHGAIDGMSLGYIPRLIEEKPGGRLLKQIDLIEISVVEEPADLGAKVESVKYQLDACYSMKEIESFLREVGRFSKADSIALIGRIKRLALGEQEAELKAKQEIAALMGIKL
jgi:HK97 family phage prohead protease